MLVVDAQDWKGLSSLWAVFSEGMVNRAALGGQLRWGGGDIPNRAFPGRLGASDGAGGRAGLEAMASENG